MRPLGRHTRRLFVFVTLGAWLALSPGPGVTRSQDRPLDNATAARIADGVEKAREGRLLDAVEQFQRVMDTAGDELVPVDGRQHAPARWVVHKHLAQLPPKGVELYRQRVDGQAAKRLEEAKKDRDDAALHRLLRDMFASRPGEEAIVELARRAFDRAEFDAAEHFWRMLLPPDPDEDGGRLHFPQPKTDAATVKAWLILLKLFRGERDEARAELEEFREKHPNATGLFAGKTGKYADTLTGLFNDPAQTTLARRPDEPGWPTFAGSAAREGNARARLPYFWPDVPTWTRSLPFLRHPPQEGADPLHRRALAFHPIVADGRAYIADGIRVLSIDLKSGELSHALWHNVGEEVRIPTRQDVRYTLMEADGVLYARLGPAALKPAEGAAGASFIAALGARKAGGEERELLWRLDPPAVPDVTTHFEGAPVVHRGRLYVGLWRQSGAGAEAGVACYRLDDPKAAPELAWHRWVGRAGSEPNNEVRYRHQLVTVSGANVVYCTDGGTVAALDALTGQPAWEYRYPRNERPALPRYRDLCPPLADGGRVYAAPADTDRLLCLDAYTGRLIWEREGVEVIHLLGTAKGRLIATFGGPGRGIRGLNLWTGADSGAGGWTVHDDGGEATFGRGLVADEVVVWPTRHGLRFLDAADGTQVRSPIPAPVRGPDGTILLSPYPGPLGNLCYADGVLLVTTATEVWGYVSEAKKLRDRRKAVEADPDDPVRNAELAQSLIDAGRHAEAEQAAAKASEARERLRWLLAEKVIRDGDRAGAKRLYGELAKGDGSFAAAGAIRLGEMADEQGKVRAKWERKWPGQSDADPEMVRVRALWMRAWEKTGVVLDRLGIPYLARSYAESHSPVPLVMRGVLTGIGGAPAAPEELKGHAPFDRSVGTAWLDPGLRILHSSERGIIAAGEHLHVFGKTIPRATPRPLEVAFPFEERPGFGEGPNFVLCGPSVLAAVDPRDGKVRWRLEPRPDTPCLAPTNRPVLPLASGAEKPPAFDALTEESAIRYHLAGRLLVSMGGYRADGVGATSVPAKHSGKFHPHAVTDKTYKLYQLSNGRMLVRYGWWDDFLHDLPCTRKPWPQPPHAVPAFTIPERQYSGDEVTKFLIPDDGGVFLFDAKAGKEQARYTIPGEDSLTGELPRFRIHRGDVLLIIDRNHGVELDRLRIGELQRAWDRSPVLVGRELDDVALAGDRFFTAADGTLAAHSWKEGGLVWETPLPDAPHTRWRLTVSPQGLLAHPAEALMLHPDFDAVGEFRRAGWGRDGLLRAMARSYDAWAARELPLLVFDPADGRLVQRLTFPAAGPAAGVAVTPKGVVVVTGKGSWTLTAK